MVWIDDEYNKIYFFQKQIYCIIFRSSAKDTNILNSSGMKTHAIWMSLTFELFSADDDN